MGMDFNVLIVDDEKEYCDGLSAILKIKGYRADTAYSGREALDKLVNKHYDLVISDLLMPEMDGSQLLREIKNSGIDTDVIIITAFGSIEKAVETIKDGAYTYVTKGEAPEDILNEIGNLYEKKKLENENKALRSRIGPDTKMIETNCSEVSQMLEFAAKAANSESNILILGESGVGKKILAEYIHSCSPRNNSNFLEINCQALTDSLLESELFGHEKGAFTGATNRHVGLFESAAGGTLFLDEIGGISPNLQAKLLKTIEEKTIYRVGSTKQINVDFRLVSATNRNLGADMENEDFRLDLFYRLSTIVIRMPALRERKADIPLFIDYFLNILQKDMKLRLLKVDDETLDILYNYDYPGNIRELKNILERLAVLSDDGVVSKSCLPPEVLNNSTNNNKAVIGDNIEISLKEMRKDVEREYIKSLIDKYPDNLDKVSDILDITRRQLFNKLTEYELK